MTDQEVSKSSQDGEADNCFYVTLVFKRPDMSFPSPFMTPNPFGEVISVGVGDEMEVSEKLREAINYALDHAFDCREWLDAWNEGDLGAMRELDRYLADRDAPRPLRINAVGNRRE